MIIQVDKVNDDYRVCCSAYPALVVIAKTREEAIKNFELELDKEIANPTILTLYPEKKQKGSG